jgi:hypothetical protein
MDDFDKALESALRADPIDERGYYREAFASLRGHGSGLRILAWAAVLIFSAGLIYCLIRMMTAPSIDQMIVFGVWCILCAQAQIALKLWFNMQLNRRAVTREIRRLEAMIERRQSE